MTTAVQHRRGTTAEHSTFTGLEGEVTIDTTKDTAVIHDGSLAGGYPLAKETLANVNPSTLSAITGAATASDDLFLMYDTSALAMKKISRAELNNAITIEALDTVDINGGTIDGTAIGGTTAAAGAFTTLSASGAVTLSGGTANGVTYLNGSKVVTSGSALTFDGSTFQADTSGFRIGKSPSDSPSANIYASVIADANQTAELWIGSNSVALSANLLVGGLGFYNTDNSTAGASLAGVKAYTADSAGSMYLNFYAGNTYYAANTPQYIIHPTYHAWSSGTTEAMRLTSTGLGIGTSSPTLIASNGKVLQITGATTTRSGQLRLSSSDNSQEAGYYVADGVVQFGSITNHPIVFRTNNTERARIESSGNLLVGTTSISSHRINIAGSTNLLRLSGTTAGLQINNPSSEVLLITSGGNDALALGSNDTERARIDSSGNVGIGTSSPAVKLHVAGRLRVVENTSIADLGSSATEVYLYNRSNSALTFGTNDTERARIDSSGNVGIGTSSPTRRLTVEASSGAATGIVASNPSVSANAVAILEAKSDSASAFLGAGGSATTASTWGGRASTAVLNTSSSTPGGIAIMARTSGAYITMHTGGDTERARIDSSGNLLVGKTATGLSTVGVEAQADGDLWATADSKQALTLRRNTTDGNIANFWKDGTTVGSISVTSSATAYNTSSDYRLKDNIQDITGSGAFIDALQPRTWNWKADGSAGAGFIAHELQVVSPSSVVGEKDAVDADGNPEYQAVEYGSAEVIAMLVAEVKSLRARLTAAGL